MFLFLGIALFGRYVDRHTDRQSDRSQCRDVPLSASTRGRPVMSSAAQLVFISAASDSAGSTLVLEDLLAPEETTSPPPPLAVTLKDYFLRQEAKYGGFFSFCRSKGTCL